ncbi:hypothetical protein QC764_0089890 [Podospora pseudoanserina]|uniref:Uncharacterized protein n=1 Tax=Podospora pseudoanserina TaxID=2609844 RepID=A0ABR0HSH8_9PEZI|nr:hypothetical protein QC764_0089890 [Podospora pseudoanserina]
MSLQGRVSSSVHVARKRVDGRKWNIQPFAVRIIHTDLFRWYTLKVSSPLDKQELTARSFLVHRASARKDGVDPATPGQAGDRPAN